MRTMYIILSWIGWGWLAVVGPVVGWLLYRQGRRAGGLRPAADPTGTEADVRP